MGVWYFCFEFVNFVSLLTNSFLLCFVSFKTFESIEALAAVAGMFLPLHVASIASQVLFLSLIDVPLIDQMDISIRRIRRYPRTSSAC